MTEQLEGDVLSLLCVAGGHACTLPLASLLETMRPLPIEALADAPEHVVGVALIRGEPLPVIDLGGLLGASHASVERFVTLSLGERRVALAVQRVIGVRRVPRTTLHELPPLFQQASAGAISAIGSLDAQLLLVLSAMHLVPHGAFEALARAGAPA